jgi:hypothetical protein
MLHSAQNMTPTEYMESKIQIHRCENRCLQMVRFQSCHQQQAPAAKLHLQRQQSMLFNQKRPQISHQACAALPSPAQPTQELPVALPRLLCPPVLHLCVGDGNHERLPLLHQADLRRL